MVATLASTKQSQMGPVNPPHSTPPTVPKEFLSRSISTTSSAAGGEKIRLRVGFGGSFVQDTKGQVKYVGGSSHLDSIPAAFKYADLVFRLTEKVNGAVSIKYLPPGDDVDEDNLVGITDDADLQEMYEEYAYSAQHSGAQGRAPRLKVFLFSASEEDGNLLTLEQDIDGCNFFAAARCDKVVGQNGGAVGMHSSADSSCSGGGTGASPEDASWNAESSRPSTQPSGAGMHLALSGIENNPFVAPWLSPGSEDTYSGLSNAVQRHVGPQEGCRAPHQTGTFHNQIPVGDAGGNKENACDIFLPSHLSIFGEGLKLPSNISIFGDGCSSHHLQQHRQQYQQQHQQGLLQQAGAGGKDPMEGVVFQQYSHGGRDAGWNMQQYSPTGEGHAQGQDIWPPLVKTPSWSRIYGSIPHVPKDAVTILGSIAEGAFGEVSIAKTPQFSEVAIKWLKPAKVERHLGAFWREADLLSKLNHPNVLRMYGVVCESVQEPTIVGIMTEFVKGGSLTANLRSQRTLLPLLLRAQLAVQIASGMAFLHESNVVHFDLKPDNLLLDVPLPVHAFMGQSVPCVKVADFGLSKEKRQSYVSGVRDLRGTLPFMAPELVNDPDRVTEKADVWSMGMLMWELLTLSSPFQDMAPNVIIAGLMKGTLRPDVPEWCEPSWAHLMRACWALDPNARPSFRSMALELEHLIQLLTASSA